LFQELSILNNTKPLHICVYGSSVSLFVRPVKENRGGGNFSEILEQSLVGIRVSNFGRPSGEIRDLLLDFDTYVTRVAPDVVVFNYGINECSPRFLPRKLFTIIHGRRLTDGYWTLRFKAVANILLNRKLGPLVLRLKGNSGWCSNNKFGCYCDIFCKSVTKENRATIIALTIPRPSNRIQKLLPGILERVYGFNNTIRKVFSKNIGPDRYLIDLEKVWNGKEETMVPDGIHFSQKGHLEIAGMIRELLLENTVNFNKIKNL
jgi:hypothetical protein